MNKLYADRNGISVDREKDTESVKLVKELAERDRQNRERGEQILDYYRNGQQKGVRI